MSYHMSFLPNVITSIYIDPEVEEVFNLKLYAKQKEIEANEIRFKTFMAEDTKLGVVAFGTAGRVAQSAIREARENGIKVGLFRPISLYPYPYKELREFADQVDALLVVEMNTGQMLEDVHLAVKDTKPISFYGRLGGTSPLPDEIFNEIQKLAAGEVNRFQLGRVQDGN